MLSLGNKLQGVNIGLPVLIGSGSSEGEGGTAPADILALVPEGYGVAADPAFSVEGAVTAGTTFVHPLNFIIKYTQVTLPTSGVSRILYHFDGSANAWYSETNDAGRARLYKVVSGSPSSQASTNAIISNGSAIYVVRAGASIGLYVDGTEIGTVSDSHAATETDGLRNNIFGGEDGDISNIYGYTLTAE